MTFKKYIKKWDLIVDGEPIITHSSQLLPVQFQGEKAMLKITTSDEERCGALLMVWWNGEGSARVLMHDNNALLMERAMGSHSLAEKVRHGFDDEASQIICSVAAKLHAKKDNPPALLPLEIWFKSLGIASEKLGGIFNQAYKTANELLASQQDVVMLHGDLHHGNILDFAERGWLAIDPKYITGERGFDFANLFCNPDRGIALQEGRLLRQLDIVACEAQLEKRRLLRWILAYSGLSAAWCLEDGASPDLALAVAEIAAVELAR